MTYFFANATNNKVVISADRKVGIATNDVAKLAAYLKVHGITMIQCSSDMDFASEEGFADDGAAHKLLNDALNAAHN